VVSGHSPDTQAFMAALSVIGWTPGAAVSAIPLSLSENLALEPSTYWMGTSLLVPTNKFQPSVSATAYMGNSSAYTHRMDQNAAKYFDPYVFRASVAPVIEDYWLTGMATSTLVMCQRALERTRQWTPAMNVTSPAFDALRWQMIHLGTCALQPAKDCALDTDCNSTVPHDHCKPFSSFWGPYSNPHGINVLKPADVVQIIDCVPGEQGVTNTGKCLAFLTGAQKTANLVYPSPWAWTIVYAPYAYPSYFLSVVLVMAVCTIVALLCVLALVLKWRDRNILRASSVSMLSLILNGALGMTISAILFAIVPTDTVCHVRIWLLPLSFMVMFGPLFIKTFRIASIFTRTKLEVVRIRDSTLMLWLMGMLCAELLILIVCESVSTTQLMTANLILKPPNQGYFSVKYCSTDSYAVIATLVYYGTTVLAGAILAWRVRNVDRLFNESEHIMYCIVFLMVYCIVLLPVQFSIESQIEAVAWLRAAGILVGVWICIGVLFIPKLVPLAVNNVTVHTLQSLSSGGSGDADGSGNGHKRLSNGQQHHHTLSVPGAVKVVQISDIAPQPESGMRDNLSKKGSGGVQVKTFVTWKAAA
jgi:hypothetical protein